MLGWLRNLKILYRVAIVLGIPPSEIEAAPSFGAKLRNDFIAGMGKRGADFVMILNIERVLALDDIGELPRADLTQQSAPAVAA